MNVRTEYVCVIGVVTAVVDGKSEHFDLWIFCRCYKPELSLALML